jgi:hypothetical protein
MRLWDIFSMKEFLCLIKRRTLRWIRTLPMCFAYVLRICALLMCFAYVLCSCTLLMWFAHVLCSCALFLCFAYVLCWCALLMCFADVLCWCALLMCFISVWDPARCPKRAFAMTLCERLRVWHFCVRFWKRGIGVLLFCEMFGHVVFDIWARKFIA